MTQDAFEVKLPPRRRSCAVFSSPHSGSDYNSDFMARTLLDALQVRSSEDAFVDELFSAAPEFGAPLIAANVPRACVDLNRDASDLDPAVIAGAARRAVNPRVSAGLGVIPRVVSEGRPIMSGKLSLSEASGLLERYWYPYHKRLRRLMVESREMFGAAILFDCHSMPQDALHASPAVWNLAPDVILGDRYGASCASWVSDAVADLFEAEGFAVARNAPFAGGYITQTYGRPAEGMHALQIEINRSLYMDEARIERKAGFAGVKARLRVVTSGLCALDIRPSQLAAE